MSVGTNGEEKVELTCIIGDLKISIVGPSDSASEFLRKILQLGSAQRPASPSASVGFFDLVSSRDSEPPQRELGSGQETKAQIEATFAECPQFYLRQANKLIGSAVSGTDRLKRAWRAGQWGGATVSGRVDSPSRSVQLDLRPRFYVVLKARGLEAPTLCSSAAAYWKIIGVLEGSDSVSHSFPSELEARAYLAGAGVEHFESSH